MHAAGAWWRTYDSLAERGLVRLGRTTDGEVVAAFIITEAGRQLIRTATDEAAQRLIARSR